MSHVGTFFMVICIGYSLEVVVFVVVMDLIHVYIHLSFICHYSVDYIPVIGFVKYTKHRSIGILLELP